MADIKIYPLQADRSELTEAASDLDFAIAMIEQLQGGLSARAPIESIMDIVNALTLDMPYMSYTIPKDFKLFRGRIKNSEDTLANVKDFSYCPVELCTSYGRCHRPNSTMFYGSTNSETVLTELTPEIGDKIHIGVTATNPDKPPRVTAIGEIDYSRRYGRPLIGNLSTYKIQNELLIRLKEQDQNRHLRVLLVDAYFTDIFSKPAYKERDYKVTSCLSELLLNIEINVDGRDITQDGFAYPSVAHRGGLNYAIAPSSFDEKFRWEKFISGEIVNYFGFGLYALKQNAEADTFEADGTINWRQL